MSTQLTGPSPTPGPGSSSASGSGGPERGLGQLFADASRDMSGLVRNEVALAKAELRGNVKAAASGGVLFGVAAFLGVVAFILLSIAAAYGLRAAGLHPGWAFAIVAGVYLLIAAIIAFVAKRRLAKVTPPTRAIETTKESVAALKGGQH